MLAIYLFLCVAEERLLTSVIHFSIEVTEMFCRAALVEGARKEMGDQEGGSHF